MNNCCCFYVAVLHQQCYNAPDYWHYGIVVVPVVALALIDKSEEAAADSQCYTQLVAAAADTAGLNYAAAAVGDCGIWQTVR